MCCRWLKYLEKHIIGCFFFHRYNMGYVYKWLFRGRMFEMVIDGLYIYKLYRGIIPLLGRMTTAIFRLVNYYNSAIYIYIHT